MSSYEDIKKNEEILAYLKKADKNLEVLGYTDDGGFLDQGNQLVADCWNDVFDRLRNNDLNHGDLSGKSQRSTCFGLTDVDRENACTNIFRYVCARVDTKGNGCGNDGGKAANGENDVRHDKQLQRHRRAANDGNVNITNDFGNPCPSCLFGDGDNCHDRTQK